MKIILNILLGAGVISISLAAMVLIILGADKLGWIGGIHSGGPVVALAIFLIPIAGLFIWLLHDLGELIRRVIKSKEKRC